MADEGRRLGSGELFPTDEPVSGDALIGRADDVDAIATSLLGAINVVLAGPRRLGETSVARAALEVCRAADVYTVAVDLFRQPDALALAESLTIAGLANRPAVRQLLARARHHACWTPPGAKPRRAAPPTNATRSRGRRRRDPRRGEGRIAGSASASFGRQRR